MRDKRDQARKPSRLAYFVVFQALIVAGYPVFALDTVAAVMKRMESDSAVRIAYRETRYLELFEKPVETSGYLYGMPPDILIKEQLEPSREVMGIFADRYYYFNPAGEVRRSRAKDPEDPLNLHIMAFQALANGNQTILYEVYQVSFYTEPGRWYLILTEKNQPRSRVRITVSGAEDRRADKMEIHEEDGDRSVYRLEEDSEGEDVRAAVRGLEAELTGR